MLPKIRRVLFVALVLASTSVLPKAADAREVAVDFLLLGEIGPKIDLGIAALLELALNEEENHYGETDFVSVSFDGRVILLNHSTGIDPETLGPCEGSFTEGLETASGLLVLQPGTTSSFLKRLEDLSASKNIPTFSGKFERINPQRRKIIWGWAQASDGQFVECIELQAGPKRSPVYWDKSLAIVYRLEINGRPTRAVVLGYSHGGLHRMVDAITRFKSQFKNGMVLSRGNSLSSIIDWDLPSVGLVAALDNAGLDWVNPSRRELDEWGFLNSYWREENPRMTFLSSNLTSKANGPDIRGNDFRDIEGVRVAFFGITNPSLQQHLSKSHKIEIKDPINAAREAVQKLRPNADLLVCLTNLSNRDQSNLAYDVHGIDLLLGGVSGRLKESSNRKVAIRGRLNEPHPQALHNVLISEGGATHLRATFEINSSGTRWIALEETPWDLGPFAPADSRLTPYATKRLERLTDSNEVLLPDPRRLFEDRRKLFLDSREFWTLAAQLLQERTRAEAGLVWVREHEVNRVGDLTAGIVDYWLDIPDRVVVVGIKGKDLKSLYRTATNQIENEKKSNRELGGTRIALAGITPDLRIHGLPIYDEEIYQVALSDFLLDNPREFPGLAAGIYPRDRFRRIPWGFASDKNGKTVRVAELVREGLQDLGCHRCQRKLLRSALLGRGKKTPLVWKLRLTEVGFNITSTRLDNNAPFSSVRNSRVRSQNQLLIGASSKIVSELYKNNWRWDVFSDLALSRVRLDVAGGGRVTNEPTDRIRLGTDISYGFRLDRITALGSVWGPFLNYTYNTEFTAGAGLQKKSLHQTGVGIHLSQGQIARRLQLGAVVQKDAAKLDPINQYGLNFAAEAVWILPGTKTPFEMELGAKYIFSTPQDTSEDLQLELNARGKLRVTLWNDLTLSPFVDLFLFKSHVLKETGTSLILGVQLDYGRLWKPLLEPWKRDRE